MIRIGICDGDLDASARLFRDVKGYLWQNRISELCDIQIFHNGVDLMEHLQTQSLDLLFLGTQLSSAEEDRGEGLEIARRISLTDPFCRIVFLSRTPVFAPGSYDVGAFYYMLKPWRQERVFSVLDRAVSQLFHRAGSLSVKVSSGLRRIPHLDILFVESIDHHQMIHLRGGDILQAASRLTDLFLSLSDNLLFIMPHRAFIVNIAHVQAVQAKNFTLSDGTSIPISKSKYKRVIQDYLKVFPCAAIGQSAQKERITIPGRL